MGITNMKNSSSFYIILFSSRLLTFLKEAEGKKTENSSEFIEQ